MAAKRRPLKIGAENKHEDCLTLHEMLQIVGNQLDDHSFNTLKTIFSLRHPYNEKLSQMKNGFETEFLIEALEKTDQLDETNFDKLHLGLVMAGRSDLIHIANLRKLKTVKADPANDFLEKMGQGCRTVYGRIHTETFLCEDNHSEGCVNKEDVQNKSEACNHSHYSKDRRENDHVPSNISKNLHSCDRCLLCDEQKLSVSTDEPKPSTSYEEKKLSLSADEPKCSVSNYKPKPSVSTDESKPSTLCEERKLSMSADEPKHSVSNYKPKPSVSTDEPKPSKSYEERKLSVSTDEPKPSTSYEERNSSSFYENSRPANYNLDKLDLCDDCRCKAMSDCDMSAGIICIGAERLSCRIERIPKFSVPGMKNVTSDCENCEQKDALHNDQSERYFSHNLCDANPVYKMEKSSPSRSKLHCKQKSNMTGLSSWKRKRKYVDEPIPSTSGCPYEPVPSTSKGPFDRSSSASECFDEGSSSVSNYATHGQLLESKNCCSKCDDAYSINFQGSPNLDCEPYSDIGYQEEESAKLNGTSSCKCYCHCDDSPSPDNYYSCRNIKMPEKSSSFASLDSITVSSQRKKLRVTRTGLQQMSGLQMGKETVMHSCRQSARLMKQTYLQQEMSSPVRECQNDQRQPETHSGEGKHEDSQGRHFSQTFDKKVQTDNSAKPSQPELKKKQTCAVRLRVRAEYADHNDALAGNIHSNKPELTDRRFEKFSQANTILKSRDLGAIICDIKFSELTYLDAFWRDYVNGSLLEALKAVFITDSLRQAVGQESIKLLVSVDEDDYEAGRLKLLQNLQD